jgi:type I restriction enzyme S subunit
MIEGLRPYLEYRESDIPWAPVLPSHWQTERAKRLFTKMQRPVGPKDDVVTCFRDGRVTLRKNRRLQGFTEATAFSGYQGIREGDLVIHGMDAFAGAIGVSDSNGKGTPVYNVCKPNPGIVAGFYAQTVREMSRAQWILALAKGIRERSTDFRYETFGNQFVPLPPPDEQAAIARFLEHANRKIDGFIRAKRREMALITEMLVKVTEEAMQRPEGEIMRLSTAAKLANRPIDRRSAETYTRVGLYNRGRGIFHKTPALGAELGDSEFFWIRSGDLVISGQFAWEGAVALARKKDDGCVASHRYPILRGRDQIVSSEVLLAILRTKFGGMLLDHHSRGAAGRNRPLNINTLLKEKVRIPPHVAQARIIGLLDQEDAVAQSVAKSIKLVEEYRTRLTADVVSGKLDVRPAAAKLPALTSASPPEPATESPDEPELEETEA